MKLLGLTKVPVILTASNMKIIKDNLIDQIKESDIKYDTVRYRYIRLLSKDVKVLLKMIFIVENFVKSLISNERFEQMKDKEIKAALNSFVKKEVEQMKVLINSIYEKNEGNLNGLLNDLQLNLHFTDSSKNLSFK
jgi:hypothetical protein